MKTERKPIVAGILLALNVIGFLFEIFKGENLMAYKYAMYEGALADGEWIRMIMSGFLHFGITHLACNMICLISYGFSLEREIGPKYFAIIYGISLLGGSLLINFAGGNALHAGASGAIWGLMTASLYLNWRSHSGWVNTLRGVVVNLIYSFSAGVSWQAHIGGGIAGIIVAVIILRTVSTETEPIWKCPYCNAVNPISRTICSECQRER